MKGGTAAGEVLFPGYVKWMKTILIDCLLKWSWPLRMWLMTQEAQEKNINNDAFLNTVYISLHMWKQNGVTPLARFSSVWQKILSRRKSPLEEIWNWVFQDYHIHKLLVNFHSLVPLYLQVLWILVSHYLLPIHVTITQDNKIPMLLLKHQ